MNNTAFQTSLVLLGGIWTASSIFPVQRSFAGFTFSFLCLLILFGVYAARQRIDGSLTRCSDSLRLPAILGLAAAVRLAFCILDGGLPFSDFADFERIAREMHDSDRWFVDPGRPPGPSWIGFMAMILTSGSNWPVWLFNAAVSTLSIYSAHQWMAEASGKTIAKIAALLLALNSEDILFTPFLATEPVFFCCFNISIWAFFSRSKHGGWLAGVVLGTAHYFRATAPIWFLAGILLLILCRFNWSEKHNFALFQWFRRTCLTIVAFGIAILPIVFHNYRDYSIISINPYHTGGWSLYLGSNADVCGFWNAKDVRYIDSLVQEHPAPADLHPTHYRDQLSLEAAKSRFRQDFLTLAKSAMLCKPYALWGDLTISLWVKLRFGDSRAGLICSAFIFLWHKLLLLLAAMGIWSFFKKRMEMAPIIAFLVVSALLFTAFHLAFNVEGRYHHVYLGLLCWAAAIFLAKSPTKSR